jgi:DNA-directed RNA polymerase specialized sigma24 family protein
LSVDELAQKTLKDNKHYPRLWEACVPTANRVGAIFGSKYRLVDADDMAQDLLLNFHKIWRRFDPAKQSSFRVYLYYSWYYMAQDFLRKLDPLGLKPPQKKPYPLWRYIAEVSEESYVQQAVIQDGFDRLDRMRG